MTTKYNPIDPITQPDDTFRWGVENLARFSGATDIDGKHALRIFCFTSHELIDFAKRLGETYHTVTSLGEPRD